MTIVTWHHCKDFINDDKAISHAFFTRKGGVSDGIYAGANFGYGSGDKPESVTQNRQLAMQQWGQVDASRLVTLYQVHSANVVIVDDAWDHSEQVEADAMVSTTPGVVLGVLTADCTPVLFADEDNKVIGAAHAGWGGAFKGVVLNVIRTMIEQGAEEENITVAIGPTIQQQSYEVGTEFRERFVLQADENHQFFLPSEREAHYQFDLPAYIKHQLLSQTNIKHIADIGLDTYEREDEFFSFRRTCHRKEKDYGRNLSVITLR